MGFSNRPWFSSEEEPQGTQPSSKGKQKALKLHYFFKHNNAFLVIMQVVKTVRSDRNTRPLKQMSSLATADLVGLPFPMWDLISLGLSFLLCMMGIK